MQGGNKARRWQSEQMEEREKDRGRGKRSKVRGVVVGVGVAVLLNFNEYQGEFLLHIFFSFSPFPFFFPRMHPSTTQLYITVSQMSFNTASRWPGKSVSLSEAVGYALRKQRTKSSN